MKCKKCGGNNTVIISRDIVFNGVFRDILYYCKDCKERMEERVWVM